MKIFLYNFFDLLINNFVALTLTIVGVILIWVAISNFLQKKYGPGGIFTLFGIIALVFSRFITKKDPNKYKKEIEKVDDKIKQHKENLNNLDKEVEKNKQQASELKEKEQTIAQELKEKLDHADNIKPAEVTTDEEVLDAFDSASKYGK